MTDPRWAIEGRNWPHRGHSRFVLAGRLRWHVQTFGPDTAPIMLLLHGTGAATHSWRDLAPLLAMRFRVIVPDLPGHGFTRGRPATGLSSNQAVFDNSAMLGRTMTASVKYRF